MIFNGSKTRSFIASLVLVSTLSGLVFANEGGGEGGEGGEKPPAKPKSNTEDYRTVLAKVQAGAQKLKASEENIQKLIHDKKSTRDPVKQKAILEEMLAEHRELKKNYDEYQKDLGRLKYEYPEKGDMAPRKYSRFRLKSLDEMEQGAGMEADLERARNQLRKTYGELSIEEKKQLLPESAKEQEHDDEILARPTLKK